MKAKQITSCGLIAVLVLTLTLTGCPDGGGNNSGGGVKEFDSIEALGKYLQKYQPKAPSFVGNNQEGPYLKIKLTVSDLTGIGDALTKHHADWTEYYISLDLSDCTFTSIDSGTFDREGEGGNGIRLTNIILPDSVTSIGDNAFSFYGSYQLKSITMKGVKTIGDYAFQGCWLTSINLTNVDTIGDWAFYSCDKLTSANLTNVNSIGKGAFSNCYDLASVDLTGVKSIGEGAFSQCGLTSVTIPASVMEWGGEERPFLSCDKLASINVDPAHPVICSVDGIMYDKDKTNLAICPAGKTGTVTIPDSVTQIGDNAFSGCSNLTAITIGNKVERIEYGAFSGCSSISSITIPDTVTDIGSEAFTYCFNLTSVTFQGVIEKDHIYASTFMGDLRTKYLEGGKGTYTTPPPPDPENPWSWVPVWTKQP